ncbi:hypothetical protein BGZ63DRAFT_46071 [Mariannaea sp. PMI_226]|nr:hypothetical protein BGZ63DRAFT_46071 [Mariannaea sp. PMI_226]
MLHLCLPSDHGSSGESVTQERKRVIEKEERTERQLLVGYLLRERFTNVRFIHRSWAGLDDGEEQDRDQAGQRQAFRGILAASGGAKQVYTEDSTVPYLCTRRWTSAMAREEMQFLLSQVNRRSCIPTTAPQEGRILYIVLSLMDGEDKTYPEEITTCDNTISRNEEEEQLEACVFPTISCIACSVGAKGGGGGVAAVLQLREGSARFPVPWSVHNEHPPRDNSSKPKLFPYPAALSWRIANGLPKSSAPPEGVPCLLVVPSSVLLNCDRMNNSVTTMLCR